MIKIQKINYNKNQHEPKFPLFYTDSDGLGLWLAVRLPKSEEDERIMMLCLVARNGEDVKGNSVSYNSCDEFRQKFIDRTILEKDVLIQY